MTDKTKGIIGAASIAKMKKGVRIINCARGGLVDEKALAEAITSGHVAGAALDVFEVEPLAPDSPLWKYDRCIFGSHNGSNSVDAVRRVSRLAIEKIERLLRTATR